MYNSMNRCRLTVRRKASSTSDGAGGRINTYDTFEVAAEIVTQRGSRNTDFEQSGIEQTKRFKVRFLPNILSTDTIIFLGKEYIISSIENLNNMNQFQILTCSAK